MYQHMAISGGNGLVNVSQSNFRQIKNSVIIMAMQTHILKAFSHGHSANQPHKNEATETQKMGRGYPKNKFQVESCQFGSEK
ncbi:hypothetical protein BpHYR1_001110 [Brachionus plicatilis]|uniref:Uncharacterized protein n=1 Tax=Brachionus plicatilis TaxID=10195 RepID=A0A3M7S850_BRAPC|nr:hypothetical protein BpHYR1_001110 [Brachionus plicatilis]